MDASKNMLYGTFAIICSVVTILARPPRFALAAKAVARVCADTGQAALRVPAVAITAPVTAAIALFSFQGREKYDFKHVGSSHNRTTFLQMRHSFQGFS